MHISRDIDTGSCLRLNWTKVGLKLVLHILKSISQYRLNWTKVGLKSSIEYPAGTYYNLFKLD